MKQKTIKTPRKYRKELRRVLKNVLKGKYPLGSYLDESDIEDHSLLLDLADYGFIDAHISEYDGGRLISLNSYQVSLSGLDFLSPPVDWKFWLPFIVSVLAFLISLVGMLV